MFRSYNQTNLTTSGPTLDPAALENARGILQAIQRDEQIELNHRVREEEWAGQSTQVLSFIPKMERAASDMQKETRGYLLTGNPVFIDAYKKATSDFYAYQGYLSVLLANESGEVNQLQKIREHLESWLTECAIPCIEAKRSGQDADWLLRADRSEFLMGNLRRAMEQFEAEQMDIYRVRSSAAARERILAATGVSMSPELAAGDYIRIRVRDEGVGIAENVLKQIFDPYFRMKPKGNGLGLATTYSIVKNHSGLITVESELHCGSTFTVYLPAACDQAVEAVPTEPMGTASSAGPLHGSGRVLVVDDEEAIRALVEYALTRFGYEVVGAESALLGIEFLSVRSS